MKMSSINGVALALSVSVLAVSSQGTAAEAAAGSIKQPAATPAAAGPKGVGVVARVGDLDVNLDEIKSALGNLDVRELAAVSRDPALLNQVVRSLLVQRLLYREALAKKWDQSEQAVARLERLRQAAVTESYLESVSQPPTGWPSDAEVQAAYEANQASWLVPRQYRLAQIYVALPEGGDQAAVNKAQGRIEAVKRKLQDKPGDFGALAKAESDEKTSAAAGGEIGWLTEAQIQPDIREAALKLAVGQVSAPIKRPQGWHIIKCLEIKEPFTPSLADLKASLVEKMREEKVKANSQAYLAQLLQENPVTINELAIGQILESQGAK
jgi:parvulin-like peptidyl-prolyl isomerase